MINYILQEAVDKTFNSAPVVAEFKKQMNTCKLTKFRSTDACSLFYSAFFMNQTNEPLTFDQWRQVYMELMMDQPFCSNMAIYMACYHPNIYEGMFRGMLYQMDADLTDMQHNRIQFLSNAKATFQLLKTQFESISTMLNTLTKDQNAVKFITTVNSVLQADIFYCQRQLDREIEEDYDPNDISQIAPIEMSETAKELIQLFESYSSYIDDQVNHDLLSESIINTAVEKAKIAKVAAQKAQRNFDELVMKKYKEMVRTRQNRKHSEMVGESLRISHEIKRLFRSGAIGIFSPAIGVITWIVSVLIDRQTDSHDRQILIDDIKDNLEIIDERIAVADRNGNDKEKIELIQAKQKLQREYKRITKVTYGNASTGKFHNIQA